LQQRAQVAEVRVQGAEQRARESQTHAADLQAQVAKLEEQVAASAKQSQEAARTQVEEALRIAKEQANGLERHNARLSADLSETKLSLAEARSDAKSAAEKLQQLRDERAALLVALEGAREVHADSENRKRSESRFAEEARQALEEARQSIRILVTAPKVSVNVGKSETDLHTPFPFAAIKEAVQTEVMPRFARVTAVGQQVGDVEIRQDVQAMVQELALSLQTKVHELMPQAEGTCNWDGFGAKGGALGPR